LRAWYGDSGPELRMNRPTSLEALLERLATLDQHIEDLQARLVTLQQLQGQRPVGDVKKTLAALVGSRVVLREWIAELEAPRQERFKAATSVGSAHVAETLRVIAKHTHVSNISIAQARNIIQDLADAQAHTCIEGRLILELQTRTGLSIADLAKTSREWLQTG
jgi:hypothetical protein